MIKKNFLKRNVVCHNKRHGLTWNINSIEMVLVRWPRELNALQIEKNTCKLRKQLNQLYNTHAPNANTTTK